MRTNILLFLCDDDIASTPTDLEPRLLEAQQKDRIGLFVLTIGIAGATTKIGTASLQFTQIRGR